eukprot:scaffold139617_cov14-Tisochrysis_lutea.AAC.1
MPILLSRAARTVGQDPIKVPTICSERSAKMTKAKPAPPHGPILNWVKPFPITTPLCSTPHP